MIPEFRTDKEAEDFYSEEESVPSEYEIEVSDDDRDISLIELEGVKYEIVDTARFKGKNYVALIPFDETDDGDDDDDEIEFTILEIVDDPDNKDNCILKTIDDPQLYDNIGNAFLLKFDSYDDE